MIKSMIQAMISPMITGMVFSDVIRSWFISLDPVANSFYELSSNITLSGDFDISMEFTKNSDGTVLLLGAQSGGFLASLVGNSFVFRPSGTSLPAVVFTDADDGKMHTIRYARASGTIETFFDGVSVATDLNSDSMEIRYIGRFAGGGYWDGIISNVSINNAGTLTTFRLNEPTDNTESSVEDNNTVTYNNISTAIRERYKLVDGGLNWLGDDELWAGSLDATGTGWTDNGGGNYTCDGTQVGSSEIKIDDALTVGLLYRCSISVNSYTAGEVTQDAGSDASTAYDANGSFTEDLTAATDAHMRFTADVDFDSSINSPSFKRLIEIA